METVGMCRFGPLLEVISGITHRLEIGAHGSVMDKQMCYKPKADDVNECFQFT
jgi:hypothetical protein